MITPDRQRVQDALQPAGQTQSVEALVFGQYGLSEQAATDLIVEAYGLSEGSMAHIGPVNGVDCYINGRMDILGGANRSPRHKRLTIALISYAKNNLGF
jgi:hypothetical protein